MKKILILIVFLTCYASASEISYVGVSPITKESETGIGLVLNTPGGSISFDTANIDLEIFYRKKAVEAFDWGFSIADIDLDSITGTFDFIYDLKVRLLKGSNIIPSIALGVNMLRFNNLDFSDLSFNPIFLNEGRLGLSWEFVKYEGREGDQAGMVKDVVYAGVNVIPGSDTLGKRYFVGAKFGNLNLVIVFQDDIRSISLGYSH